MSYNKGDRCLYSLTIDLVLVTKYRKKIIDKGILERLQEIVANTCEPGWLTKVVRPHPQPLSQGARGADPPLRFPLPSGEG